MGLFDRKHCDLCGGEIGLFGNTKLADGNMCKHCAENVSPWLSSKKQFTIMEMNEHLQYRQFNRDRLTTFINSAVIGSDYKLHIDAQQMQWYVTRYGQNPDIFNFNQVSGCDVEIKDYRHELYWEDPEHHRHSYNPPEYDYDYDFYVHIYVITPFTNEITFRVNSSTIKDDLSIEYKQAEADAFAMKSVLDQMMSGAPEIQIPGALVMDSLYISDLDAQRYERDRLRQERMRAAGFMIGGAIPPVGPHVQTPHSHPVPQTGPTPRQYGTAPQPPHPHGAPAPNPRPAAPAPAPRPATPVRPTPPPAARPVTPASSGPRPAAPAPARPTPPPAARPVTPASSGPRPAAPAPARPTPPVGPHGGRPTPPVGPHGGRPTPPAGPHRP